MKKTLLILLLVTCAYKSNAQVPDTLAYLKSIVANKGFYIGEPFSVLQNNLQIQIKYYSGFPGNPDDTRQETSTSFSFYFPINGKDDFYLTYPKMDIIWQVPLNRIQSDIIWSNNNFGGWSAAASAFYANAIIKDIRIRE